jgi:signal transduction histidine kinase
VEAHGEQIWVDEVPEGGARFAFTLPLVASNGVRP